MGAGDDLLRAYGPSHIREYAFAILDGVRDITNIFGDSVYCDSEMAAHRSCPLDLGDAFAGYSGNDRRSSGSFQLRNFYAQATRNIGRQIWSISFRHIRACAWNGRAGDTEGNALVCLGVVVFTDSSGGQRFNERYYDSYGSSVFAAMTAPSL